MKKNKKIILIICVLLVICSFVGFLIYYNTTAKQYKEYQYLQIDGYHIVKWLGEWSGEVGFGRLL